MQTFIDGFTKFAQSTGIALLFDANNYIWWQTLIMIAIACVLLYLAIVKKFEPLLLVPIAFGMLLANLPQTASITLFTFWIRLKTVIYHLLNLLSLMLAPVDALAV